MKQAILILGVVAVGACLLPAAQESAAASAAAPVVAPPAAVTPAVPAAKPAKGGSSLLGMAGGASTNNEGMMITAERMELDYKETNAMVVAFDENVHVTDPRFSMTADRMLVFFEGTNQIKRIIAIGKVDVTQPPDRHATCEKTVFERASGEIIMTGTPVLMRGADRVAGTRIIVFQNDQRVVVEGGGRLNLAPDTVKKREIKP